MHNNAMI